MANIPITGGGNLNEHKIWFTPSGGKRVEYEVEQEVKGLTITVTSTLANKKVAKFTLPMGETWEIKIDKS